MHMRHCVTKHRLFISKNEHNDTHQLLTLKQFTQLIAHEFKIHSRKIFNRYYNRQIIYKQKTELEV